MSVLYREFHPGPALAPFVRCFWLLRSSGGGIERVVPDGCAELVLNRADPFRRSGAEGWRAQPRILLVGQIRSAAAIAPTGAVDLFGIRFEPAGLHALLGIPMHELTELDCSLDDVNPALHRRLDATFDLPHLRQRIAAVRRTLMRALHSAGTPDLGRSTGLGHAAVRSVERGCGTAGEVAADLGVGCRALERAFRREIGLSPKLFIRIRRLQSVLGQLDAGRLVGGRADGGWAGLAQAHGYADQSHLIRDFRLLAGTTPRRYQAERTPMGACFELGELSHSSNR